MRLRKKRIVGSHKSERESDKSEQHKDNSVETKYEETEINNEVNEARSTPEPIIPTSAQQESSTTTTMTEANHEIIERRIESENESGEGSEGDDYDERRSDVDEEEKHSELHHQSSTVKSDVSVECDDGLRLDSDGKCVGELD